MIKEEKIKWIIKQHNDTNHMYDTYLPYEFHLRMAVEVFKRHKNILPLSLNDELVIELACWGHDLIEDTRVTYNNVKDQLGENAAEIIRAVTNLGRGRTRDERMPDFVYEDIRNTPGATFVKLCDRIANVQYGKMMGSSMFTGYQNENKHFLTKLDVINMDTIYNPMVHELNELLIS